MNKKALLALFLISLVVNISLLFYSFRRPRPGLEQPQAKTPSEAEASSVKPAARSVEQAVANPEGKGFTWRSIESSDYRQYAANLRSVGCPEETIRDILRADVTRLYEEKKKQLRRKAPKFEYWKQEFLPGVGREAWIGMLALDEERDAVLRALGIEPSQRKKQAKASNAFEWMLDFLDDHKKAQIVQLRNELDDKLAMRGPEVLQKEIEDSIQQTEDSIKRLLTPEEALQYDLRMSPTANSTRQQLQGFEPTEEEFISIFKLRKAFDDEFGSKARNETVADGASRQGAEQQLREQIKEALGPQRFADYEMALVPGFQQVYLGMKQAGFGAGEARQIYTMKQAAQEHAARIRNDQNISAEQRSAALDSIRQETERSIQTALGDNGWQQFNRGSNTRWLQRLNAREDQLNTGQPPP